MKRKYLDARNWTWLDNYTYEYKHIEGKWSGYLSVVKMGKVKQKLMAHYGDQEICLCDDNYVGIMFLPDNETWCGTAVYDDKGQIVEWYFDMTKQNGVGEDGMPYFDDLYLDIAVTPDFKARMLDEDELQEALDKGIITKADYDLAYETYEYVLHQVIADKTFLVDFFNQYL
ncbi:MAG: DUF402 domain-containing protein [Cellulosilyticaceae bacterium]